MLKLKPNCECCDVDLLPESKDARICSFECTFCSRCVDLTFKGVCPNCGGNFMPRPIRTASGLKRFPAAKERFIKAHDECQNITNPDH